MALQIENSIQPYYSSGNLQMLYSSFSACMVFMSNNIDLGHIQKEDRLPPANKLLRLHDLLQMTKPTKSREEVGWTQEDLLFVTLL